MRKIIFAILILAPFFVCAQQNAIQFTPPPPVENIEIVELRDAERGDSVSIPISDLNEITSKLGLSFDEYVAKFLEFRSEHDTLHSISAEEMYAEFMTGIKDSLETANVAAQKSDESGVFAKNTLIALAVILVIIFTLVTTMMIRGRNKR